MGILITSNFKGQGKKSFLKSRFTFNKKYIFNFRCCFPKIDIMLHEIFKNKTQHLRKTCNVIYRYQSYVISKERQRKKRETPSKFNN